MFNPSWAYFVLFWGIIQMFSLSFLRYWNDQETLKKIGEAMGFAAGGEGATSSAIPGTDETEEASEDESVVHQCASVGDAEVTF